MATTSTYNDEPILTHNDVSLTTREASQYGFALGRLCFSLIFIFSGLSHFTPAVQAYAASQGVMWPGFLVPLSGLLAIVGGLSILLGYHARIGALLIALFLIPVTFMMHNFWVYSDPVVHQMQLAHFMKNVGLFGGALMLMYLGSGPVSVDRMLRREATVRK